MDIFPPSMDRQFPDLFLGKPGDFGNHADIDPIAQRCSGDFLPPFLLAFLFSLLETLLKTLLDAFLETFLETLLNAFLETFLETLLNAFLETFLETLLDALLETFLDAFLETLLEALYYCLLYRTHDFLPIGTLLQVFFVPRLFGFVQVCILRDEVDVF